MTNTDVFMQFGCAERRFARLYSPNSIGFDGTNYFYGGTGTGNRLVFECGPTEPIF